LASHGGLKQFALPEYEAYNTIMRNLIKNGIPEDKMNDGNYGANSASIAFAKKAKSKIWAGYYIASKKL
jgi:hypothetical protein